METYQMNMKCEAIDCVGVWCTAKVINMCPLTVTFPCWSAKYNRQVKEGEIRTPTVTDHCLNRREKRKIPEPRRRLERGDVVWTSTEGPLVVKINDTFNSQLIVDSDRNIRYNDVFLHPFSVQENASQINTPAKKSRHNALTNAAKQDVHLQPLSHAIISGVTVTAGDFIKSDIGEIFVETLQKCSTSGEIVVNGCRCEMLGMMLVETGEFRDNLTGTVELIRPKLSQYWKTRSHMCALNAFQTCHELSVANIVNMDSHIRMRQQVLAGYVVRELRPNKLGRGKSCCIPVDIACDPILFKLNTANAFRRELYPQMFCDIDSIIGKGWDFVKLDEYYLVVTKLSIAIQIKSGTIKFSSSHMQSALPWTDTYRTDTITQLKLVNSQSEDDTENNDLTCNMDF